jgi:hypothetical protein
MNSIDISNATPEQLNYLFDLAAFGITDINTLSKMTLLPVANSYEARVDAFEADYEAHIEELCCPF